eukprot:768759-Hanusia_phi.AAC.6
MSWPWGRGSERQRGFAPSRRILPERKVCHRERFLGSSCDWQAGEERWELSEGGRAAAEESVSGKSKRGITRGTRWGQRKKPEGKRAGGVDPVIGLGVVDFHISRFPADGEQSPPPLQHRKVRPAASSDPAVAQASSCLGCSIAARRSQRSSLASKASSTSRGLIAQ